MEGTQRHIFLGRGGSQRLNFRWYPLSRPSPPHLGLPDKGRGWEKRSKQHVTTHPGYKFPSSSKGGERRENPGWGEGGAKVWARCGARCPPWKGRKTSWACFCTPAPGIGGAPISPPRGPLSPAPLLHAQDVCPGTHHQPRPSLGAAAGRSRSYLGAPPGAGWLRSRGGQGARQGGEPRADRRECARRRAAGVQWAAGVQRAAGGQRAGVLALPPSRSAHSRALCHPGPCVCWAAEQVSHPNFASRAEQPICGSTTPGRINSLYPGRTVVIRPRANRM